MLLILYLFHKRFVVLCLVFAADSPNFVFRLLWKLLLLFTVPWGKWTKRFMKKLLIIAEAGVICLICLILKMIPVQMVVAWFCFRWFLSIEQALWFTYLSFATHLSAWDYSAWVRSYALFLEERLECFRVLKYDVEIDPPVSFCFQLVFAWALGFLLNFRNHKHVRLHTENQRFGHSWFARTTSSPARTSFPCSWLPGDILNTNFYSYRFHTHSTWNEHWCISAAWRVSCSKPYYPIGSHNGML